MRSFSDPSRRVAHRLASTRLVRMAGALVPSLPIIVGYAMGAGAVALGTSFLIRDRFVSRATLTVDAPSTTSLTGGFAAIGQELGLTGLEGQGSSEFYSSLLLTREVLIQLLETHFPAVGTPSGKPLFMFYTNASTLTPLLRDRLLRKLASDIDATVDARTGVVRVQASADDPVLAAEILDSLVAITDRYAIANLNGRAKARREFAEREAEVARKDLQDSEDSLRLFYDRNRRIADSPKLQFEEGRLRRRVEMRQDVYVSLTTEFNQARIDEVRDTPVLNVLDPPLVPTKHESPKRTAIAIIAALVAGALAVFGLLPESTPPAPSAQA